MYSFNNVAILSTSLRSDVFFFVSQTKREEEPPDRRLSCQLERCTKSNSYVFCSIVIDMKILSLGNLCLSLVRSDDEWHLIPYLPCEQRFSLSCMAFSVYEVVRVACLSCSWKLLLAGYPLLWVTQDFYHLEFRTKMNGLLHNSFAGFVISDQGRPFKTTNYGNRSSFEGWTLRIPIKRSSRLTHTAFVRAIN